MMFTAEKEMNRGIFKSKLPKRESFEHQQNQKTNIAEYQEIIPNRKLTVKRGVFPYAIHANPVSKREVFKKDQHTFGENEGFQKSKNAFHLFDKTIPNEESKIEKKSKPSTSTGFFRSNKEQLATPLESKKLQKDDVTFSNSSTTTEMNKKVLLNQYLTQQYNAVLKAKASGIQSKYINFDAQEALQICTYKQIGEMINKSFIEASSKFKSSLEMTSTIRKDLIKLHIQRKYERKSEKVHNSSPTDSSEFPKNTVHTNHYAAHKRKRLNENIRHAHSLIEELPGKSDEKNKIIPDNGYDKFHLNDDCLFKNESVSQRKGNNVHNQFNEENDKTYRHSCNLLNILKKGDVGKNRIPSPPPNTDRNFICDFEKKKQESELIENFDDRGFKHTANQLKCRYKVVRSPTLFFSDTDDSETTPKKDKRKTEISSRNNVFSLDSAVFKRKFSPELSNPIEIFKRTHQKSKSNKKKTTQKKFNRPNPYYSDSTCHGGHPFKRYKNYDTNRYCMKNNKYSKFDLNKQKYFS